MSDPRTTPDPAVSTSGKQGQITSAVVDLCRRPEGPRDRQLIYGDQIKVLQENADWSYVQSDKDNYVGHIRSHTIGQTEDEATHQVIAPATHAYESSDFKSPDRISLSFGSTVAVTRTTDRFAETTLGHIPLVHLAPSGSLQTDPAQVATLFLGTPYLWGGNTCWGIDCSGLVQAALLACGIPCPGDSDMQESLGSPATGPYKRNDLLFWKGHVAVVTDPNTLIHANAATMSTNFEPIEAAINRIATQGDGPLTAHRRL